MSVHFYNTLQDIPTFLTSKAKTMKAKFKITDTETGTLIDVADTMKEAKEIVAEYELIDKREGTYTPEFYEIVEIKN